jgi:hypothetical protein
VLAPKKWLLFFKNDPSNWLWVLFGLAAVVMTMRNILLPSGDAYTHYNNYIIFKNSFSHWWDVKNLYLAYPSEQYDLFKYAPVFAMFFGAFVALPDWLGLGLWNLLNVWVLVYAVKKIPLPENKTILIMGILLLQETITATINSQSNALIAGLLILGWLSLEKNNWWKAALFISLTVFIKLFGVVFFALFLLYPKWWKGIIPAISICLVLFLIPAISGGIDGLIMQYKGYLHLLANDHGEFVKYSVMGWLKSWFGIQPNKNSIVLIGLLLQIIAGVLMLFNSSKIKTFHKALYAGSWMIWMVIFNHMAESATFVIAVAGVLIWFFYSHTSKWWRMLLLIGVIAFTCFGPSDIYPRELRIKIVEIWQLKVFPCILVWLACMAEIMGISIPLAQRKNS